jgi:hypothetical protein
MNTPEYMRYNTEILKQEDVDKLCKAYFEKEDKWYNAIIINLDSDE